MTNTTKEYSDPPLKSGSESDLDSDSERTCFGCGKVHHGPDGYSEKKYILYGLEVEETTCSSNSQCKWKAREKWLDISDENPKCTRLCDGTYAKLVELILGDDPEMHASGEIAPLRDDGDAAGPSGTTSRRGLVSVAAATLAFAGVNLTMGGGGRRRGEGA